MKRERCRRSGRSRGRGRLPAAPRPALCASAPSARTSTKGRRAATRRQNLAFGDRQALAQFGQRVAAQDRRHQQPVGFERAPHLDQRAGQIVDCLQREQRDGEVEAALGDGQPLEVADGGQERAGPEAGEGRRDADEAIDLATGRERSRAVRDRASRNRRRAAKRRLTSESRSPSSSAARARRKSAPPPDCARAQARSRRRLTRARSKISGGGAVGGTATPYAPVVPSRKAPRRANIRPMSADSASFDRAAGPSWTRRASAFAQRFADAALNALYPPTCLACRAATGRAWRLVSALLERDALHRAAVLRAPRHAVRAGPRRRAPFAAGDGRSARFRPRPRRRPVRGRAGAHACASAQIFRPGGTRAPDRPLDGSRRRRHPGRRRSPGAGAAASVAALAPAVQSGGRARPRKSRARPASPAILPRFCASRRRRARWA